MLAKSDSPPFLADCDDGGPFIREVLGLRVVPKPGQNQAYVWSIATLKSSSMSSIAAVADRDGENFIRVTRMWMTIRSPVSDR
ncbi:hypothetical protein Pan14r_10470 [Crateriforma conspicua]|uniref:Uncharacterized protein n=1 Tax=Crateriforma conspicua TaxID=2527996 RepID=A0A5C5Y0S1_9PLAN|nr:hypothetical protein Pan14r_10470 [Crateriforma conspicua]